MYSELYIVIFIFGIIFWPFIFALGGESIILSIMFFLNIVLFGLVYYFCSGPVMTYFEGLRIISNNTATGCVNISIVVVPFMFGVATTRALYHIAIGFNKGRVYTSSKWIEIVESTY